MKTVTSSVLKDHKQLNVQIITTAANTTAYHLSQTQGAEHGEEAEIIKRLMQDGIRNSWLSMAEVLALHFKEEQIVFFHQSDVHKDIEGDTYVRYHKVGDSIRIWYGSDNGEACLLVTQSALEVDRLLRILKGLR